jgi:hypothetical protein
MAGTETDLTPATQASRTTEIEMRYRNDTKRKLPAFIGAMCVMILGIPLATAAPQSRDDSFEKQVQPILSENCAPCHDSKTRSSGLSIETRADFISGGAQRGALVQPGDPDGSALIKVLRGEIRPQMPLGRPPLSDDKINVLINWIKQLPPRDESSTKQTATWWAIRGLQRVEPPTVKKVAWVRNPIDNFVLRKLEENGLSPSPPAARPTLIRRVYFDLIGLPPTPAEVHAFVEDKSFDAYEKLVDRLLTDPRYGERWGRHWLDLARYADTRGFEGDPELSHAWRYRDYVIASFNKDKPYDRFIKEQLAGDEIVAANDEEDDGAPRRRQASPEGQIALGFLRLGPWFPGGGPSIQSRQIMLDEMTSTVGSVFLGLTLKCAQCHDHKYDPIPQKDYYRLEAFFAPIEIIDSRVEFAEPDLRARMDARHQEYAEKLKIADDEFKAYQGTLLAKLSDVLKAQGNSKVKADIPELTKRLVRDDAGNITASQDTTFTAEEKQRYLDLLELVDPTAPGNRQPGLLRRQVARYEPVAHTARNFSSSPLVPNRPVTHVLIGGEFDKLGDHVEPGFLSAVTGNSEPAVLPTEGFGNVSKWRSVLADWIASPQNPLTARVMVNRIWQYHFGTGIVATSSDFGKNGARPTHPELLDWLSLEFVRKGWSIKAMHRLIMTSSTYQQSSEAWSEGAAKVDSGNALLWRMNRTRLEGEIIRDSILAVSGRLNLERGGPAIFPPMPEELANLRIKNRLVWEPPNGTEALRRSVYIMQRRQMEVPFLGVMDAPVLNDSCERRFVSTTSIQALSMMDGALVNEESKYFAQRVTEQAGPSPANQISLAFELALSRPPDTDEANKAEQYLKGGGNLTGLCRILFNTNEFVYVR